MAKKLEIVTVGLHLASQEVDLVDFDEKRSLLEWDIVIFRPSFDYLWESYKTSPKAKAACEHWQQQLLEAVDSRITVIIHLNKPDFINERRMLGVSSYSSLPVDINSSPTHGRDMVLHGTYQSRFASYWKQFGEQSSYEVILPDEIGAPCIVTKRGAKPVGAGWKDEKSGGLLLLLPHLNFDGPRFVKSVDGQLQFTTEARQFASRYIREIVELHKALRSESDETPPPAWLAADRFQLSSEAPLQKALQQAEQAIEKAQQNKEAAAAQLAAEGQLRNLLFAKGEPLEAAVLQSLHLLGFKADRHVDDQLEIDAIFESEEGRFIGEVTGKENSPVDATKLRQLSDNIFQDLEENEVEAPAKGILFGNAHLLEPPETRQEHFTKKCKGLA